MIYLGIDQSLTSPGFAAVATDGKYISSTTLRISRALKGPERLLHIAKGLVEFVSMYDKVLACAREGYSVNSVNRPFDLGTVAGAVDLTCAWFFESSPYVVAPTSLKKFATGSGSASKQQMLYAVSNRFPIDLGDRDDEADAIFLALFARSMHSGDFKNAAEAEVTYSYRTPKPSRLRRVRSNNNV